MGKNSIRVSNDLSGLFEKLKSSKTVVDSHLSIFIKLAQNCTGEHDESSELTYVINRLVRGLGSANCQLQQSYFAGLAVLPEVFSPPLLTVEHVFKAVKKELTLINNLSKKEEGQVCMGQILAYGALIESGLLVQTGTAEEQRTVVKQLLDLSKKRSYLPHLVNTFLDKLIASADETMVSEIIWPEISEEITSSKPVTLMMNHLALLCSNRFSSVVDADVHRIFGAKTVINSGNIDDITHQFTSVQAVSLLQHKLYMDVCAWIVESKSKTGLLKRFWSHIETQYITTNCTPHKQAVALKIFMLIISKLKDISQILTLLSPNFKKLLLQFYGKDIKLVFDTIIATVTRNSSDTPVEKDTLIELIKILIFIDSKVTQAVINRLDEDGVLKLSKFLHSVITGSSTSDKKNSVNDPEKWSNREKICAVHALCRLIGHRECEKNIEWRTEQLKFLIDLGFFIDPSMQGIGIELACVVRDGLYSALNHRAQTLNDLRTILSKLVHHFNSHLSKGIKMRIRLTDEMQAAWERLMTVIKSIEKKDAKDGSEKWQISIFHTMFLQIGLLLFQNMGFDKDCLEELHSIYERTGKKNNRAEEPHWTDVVIELFLSLLSRNNHLYRHVIGCVFSHLCPQLTSQNIHQILQVLDPKRESNPLIDINENTDSEDEKVDEADEVSSNEEGDDEDDDDDDDVESEEEEEEEGTVTDKLRMAVREALGDAGTCTDTESVDVDELDEEEGKRVDEALSLAFKSVRQARVKRQTAKQKTLTHFRIRVIDLLDIWLNRTSPPLDLVLDVMVTFLSLLEYSMTHNHEEPLESRTRVCLKKLTSIKKFSSSTSEVTETQLADVFKVLLDKETKRATLFSGLSSVITDCCVFILKASQHLVSDSSTNIKMSPVFCVCRDAMNDFFVKRDCLLPLALCESLFRLPWKGTWQLASLLPNFLFNPDVRPFRQTQALYLLHIFFKNQRLISDASRKETKDLISISSQLHNVALKVLATDGPCRLQAKFVRELVTLLRITINAKWNAEDDTKETLSRLEKFIKTCRQQNANFTTAAATTIENNVNGSLKKRKKQSDVLDSVTDSNKKSSTQNSSRKEKSKKSLHDQEESNIVTKKVKLNSTAELST